MKSPVRRLMSSTLAKRPSSSRPRSISLRAPAPIMLRAEWSGTEGTALAVENEVQRVDQVGRRIHERAVKIEYNGSGRGHSKPLSVRGQSCKVG